MKSRSTLLYIAIPFCLRDSFCEGTPLFYGSKESKATYLNTLQSELENIIAQEDLQGREIAAVHFGGAAPSIMNADRLGQLALFLRRNLPLATGCPFSLKALPQTIGTPSLSAWGVGNFNQIELDVLSLQPDELIRLNTSYRVANIQNAILFLDKFRYHSVSTRLMYGIKGQALSDWKKTLRSCLHLEPHHVTVTPSPYENGEGWTSNESTLIEFYEFAQSYLMEKGYKQKTMQTFSRRESYQSYTTLALEGADIMGVGAGARSHLYGYRYQNTCSFDAYIDAYHDFTKIIENVFEEDEATQQISGICNDLALLRSFTMTASLAEPTRDFVNTLTENALVDQQGDDITLTSKGAVLWPSLYTPEGIPEYFRLSTLL